MATILADVEEVPSAIFRFIERFPHAGIFASLSGFGASLLTAAKVLSVFFGFAGAVFGCIAGYYTMRVWHKKWRAMNPKN